MLLKAHFYSSMQVTTKKINATHFFFFEKIMQFTLEDRGVRFLWSPLNKMKSHVHRVLHIDICNNAILFISLFLSSIISKTHLIVKDITNIISFKQSSSHNIVFYSTFNTLCIIYNRYVSTYLVLTTLLLIVKQGGLWD